MTLRQSVVLFDGACNLCHGFVRFVIERDARRQFAFASLQSEVGRTLLAERGRAPVRSTREESLVLIHGEEVYGRSSAALPASSA